MTRAVPDARPAAGARAARLVVYHRAPAEDPGAVERAYALFAPEFLRTPGVLGVQLLRLTGDPLAYAVVTDWRGADAYEAWRQGPAHQRAKTPLRPYQDPQRTPCYELYDVLTPEPAPRPAPAPASEPARGAAQPHPAAGTTQEKGAQWIRGWRTSASW